MIPFFKKPYKVRRFGKERVVNGYPTAGYADIEPVLLDVQEQSYSTVAEEHGKRSPMTLLVLGRFSFVSAKPPHIKGDLLFYKDDWYECKSCIEHRNTVLKHYESIFALDPNGGVHYEF